METIEIIEAIVLKFLAMGDTLLKQIIDAAQEVHQHLKGPGLLETVYESALCYELLLRGIKNRRQVPIPVTYKDTAVRDPLFLDILVEEQVIVEIKATGKDYPLYHAQLYTHLRLLNKKSGLLINFGKSNFKDAVFIVTDMPEPIFMRKS